MEWLAASTENRPVQRARHRRSRNNHPLTSKGRDLRPALMALIRWGERRTLGPEGPVLDAPHTDCDAPVRVVVEYSAEHPALTPGEVTAWLGPGARLRSWAIDLQSVRSRISGRNHLPVIILRISGHGLGLSARQRPQGANGGSSWCATPRSTSW